MKASFYTESILYWGARALSGIAQRLPPERNAAVGRAIGTSLYHVLSTRRFTVFSNLRAAFGNQYTPGEYSRLIKQMFQNLGMQLMEIAAIPAIDRAYVDRWVEIPDGSRARLESQLAKGKGVVFMTGHFGNWELISLTAALHGFPMMVLAREQGWPRLNRLLTSFRESKGCKVITKGFPFRQMIHGIEEGRIIGILADQDAGRNGVLAPFFGRLASTGPGAIALGLNAGSPIMPAFLVRTGGPRHRLELGEPLVIPETGTFDERVRAGVAAYVKEVERYVRKYPSQWLWFHRRWKTCPQRRILLFTDGKTGHLNQMKALAQKIEAAWTIKTRDDKRLVGHSDPLVLVDTVKIEFKSPAARTLLATVAALCPKNFQGADRWFKRCLTRESYEAILSRHADISISCGAATAGVNLLWSKGIRAKAVHIFKNGWPSWRKFHLAVIPRHDNPGKGKNLLLIDGALAPEREAEPGQRARWEEKLKFSKTRRIGVLLGGPAKGIDLTIADVEPVLQGILSAARALDAELLVTTSRRTPAEVEALIEKQLAGEPRCKLLVLVNKNRTGGLKETAEAVPCILELAQTIVVSGDSISMVSEAAAKGKQVLSFLPHKSGSEKHATFLKQMDSGGRLTLAEPAAIGEELVRLAGNGTSPGAVPSGDPVVERLVKWL